MPRIPDRDELSRAERLLLGIRDATVETTAPIARWLRAQDGHNSSGDWTLNDPTIVHHSTNDVDIPGKTVVLDEYGGLVVTRTMTRRGERISKDPAVPELVDSVVIGISHPTIEGAYPTVRITTDGDALFLGEIVNGVPDKNGMARDKRLSLLQQGSIEGLLVVSFIREAAQRAHRRMPQVPSRRLGELQRRADKIIPDGIQMHEGMAVLLGVKPPRAARA